MDDDYLAVSALQHLAFCPRQCALIHIEREWEENILTARGRLEHERVDDGYREFRRGKKQFSGLSIRSEKLHLQGRIDVLEMELITSEGPDNMQSFGLKGLWRAYPVEFKHGEPKQGDCDRIQLCAQVICLEEMLTIHIDQASLFYQKIRRREDVAIVEALRNKTERYAAELHALFKTGKTPAPIYSPRCKSCSLIDLCLPKKLAQKGGCYRQMLFTPQEPLS